MSGGDGPLRRWSRRKSAARRGEATQRGAARPRPVDEEAVAVKRAATAAGAASAPMPDADADPADYGLPALESLDKDSDFTGFLATGVPEVLKRAALRKLWRSDPVLANLDGLNDYDQDFNLIDRAISAADTRYRVGKGMLDDEDVVADAEREAEAEEKVTPEVDTAGEPSDAFSDAAPGDEAEATGEELSEDEAGDAITRS